MRFVGQMRDEESSMAKLSALQVKNAKPGRHADGNGLYLLVRPSGSRSWVLRAQVNGKRQDLGLGSTTLLTLAEARVKAFDMLKRLKLGEPLRPLPADPVRVTTFEEAARQCFDALKEGWSNKNHKANWIGSLEAHVFPLIGTKPVDVQT